MVNLSIYALLGILEFLMLVVALSLVLFVKWRGAQQKARALQQALKERSASGVEIIKTAAEGQAADKRSYAEFLREQLEQSSIFLGQDPGADAVGAVDHPADDPAALEKQMLAARHQFLQLELDVQALTHGRDVETRQKKIVSAMQALLAGLRMESSGAGEESSESDSNTAAPSTALDEETKLRDQILHLRSVIDNQHQVMRDLRTLLEKGGDSDELREAMRKLDDAEMQSRELNRCLEVMEQENERLKDQGGLKTVSKGSANSPDSDMLRDLVGNQQRTIANLQQALKQMIPDVEQAKDFHAAIDKIQRTNNELNSCVMVLEDENSMLRNEVDELKERIAGIETYEDATAAMPAVAAAAAAAVVTEQSSAAAEHIAESPATESELAVVEASEPELSGHGDDVDIDALLDAAAAKDETAVESKATADAIVDSRAPSMEDEIEVDDIDELLAAAGKGQAIESVEAHASAQTAKEETSKPAPEPAAETKLPSLTESETDQDDIDALLADLMGESDESKAGN